jgi:hypothetical protein
MEWMRARGEEGGDADALVWWVRASVVCIAKTCTVRVCVCAFGVVVLGPVDSPHKHCMRLP